MRVDNLCKKGNNTVIQSIKHILLFSTQGTQHATKINKINY